MLVSFKKIDMARGDGIRAYHKCARDNACKGIYKKRRSGAALKLQSFVRGRQSRRATVDYMQQEARRQAIAEAAAVKQLKKKQQAEARKRAQAEKAVTRKDTQPRRSNRKK